MTSTSAVSSTTSSTAAAASTASPSASSLQSTFLTLLTTQLQNQDPLNPMDNSQMTSQLAQISTVNGIQQLNTTMQSMMTSAVDTQTSQAAGLIGMTVLVPGNSMTLATSGTAPGGFDLASAADSATVTIKDASGNTVRTMSESSLPAGTNQFIWDGNDNSGKAAPAGTYSFTVTALQGGNAVTTTPLSFGQVNSISRSGTSLSLNVGSGAFALSDIRQIY